MLVLNTSLKFKSISLLLIGCLIGSNLYFCPCIRAAADSNDLNFKVYNPSPADLNTTEATKPASDSSTSSVSGLTTETPVKESSQINDSSEIIDQADSALLKPGIASTAPAVSNENTDTKAVENKADQSTATKDAEVSTAVPSEDENKTKVLQGYVRVVPTGTKISIIMDTAVDSDTSQEGDEFSARSAEDLTIDGTAVVPAGSIIRGRIATLNAPKHLNRSGSVALKFDSVTTPDNRQIPLVANLVARGGVVHARRGLKDIAIDTGTFALPTAVALGIGAVAGHSSSSVGVGGGALIGAAVGAAIGVAILMAKKGKRVDVRPGDELKIELAEDLHMPSM